MKNTLITQLVGICGDYKNITFNNAHVERWINQFNLEDHIFILESLVKIFKKTYFSEEYINRIIHRIGEIINSAFTDSNIKIGILDINKKGGSQTELGSKLKKYFDSVNRQSEIVSIEDYCLKTCDKYIYLDDFLYTGNKLKYALKDIYPFYQNRKDIFVYFVGMYNQGVDYVLKDDEVRDILSVGVKRYLSYNNILTNTKSPFTVLYPEKKLSDSKLTKGRLYHIRQDFLFDKNQDRVRLENIFFEYGENIINSVMTPAANVKALGFTLVNQWGFGNMVVLYRNISNNSPLALWYGDAYNCNNGVLGRFYPLFPRKVN